MTNQAKEASEFVNYKIGWLRARAEFSAGKADLARLRRGIGKLPGSQPELWQIIFEDMPKSLHSSDDRPSFGEWAVHTALTLYALHQQGEDPATHCVSRAGMSLGRAVRKLVDPGRDNETAVKRRFNAAATSGDLTEFSQHLRGLVQLLRANDIALDYPALSEDLFCFQFADRRDSVRLGWGRDFYHMTKEEKTELQAPELQA